MVKRQDIVPGQWISCQVNGYRARSMDIADALVLAGAVESQDGGRTGIVDGGDGDKLEPEADRMRSALSWKRGSPPGGIILNLFEHLARFFVPEQ
jgi:hypothetical protein